MLEISPQMKSIDMLRIKIENMNRSRQEARAFVEAEGMRIFAEVFTDIFSFQHPIVSISWTQYTPYFNDGEPCHFSVRDFNFSLESPDGDEYDGGWWAVKNHRDISPEVLANLEARLAFLYELRGMGNDIYLWTFGDGYKVTATRNGLSVTECYHE